MINSRYLHFMTHTPHPCPKQPEFTYFLFIAVGNGSLNPEL